MFHRYIHLCLVLDSTYKLYRDICLPLSDLLGLVLEKAMATHSSALAWKIPWTEEPGGLQSVGSLSWT